MRINAATFYGIIALASISIPLDFKTRLFAFDILCIIYLCSAIQINYINKQLKYAIILLFIYGFILLISTVYHNISLIFYIKRYYSAILLIIELILLVKLLQINKKIYYKLLIFFLSLLAHYFYPNDERIFSEPLKFLAGLPLIEIILILYLIIIRKNIILIKYITIIYIIYNLLIGNRSVGGILILTILITRIYKINYINKLSNFKLLLLSIILVIIIIYLYTEFALIGLFGERISELTKFQNELYGNILLGGRPEIVFNLRSFFENPLIGSGPYRLTSNQINDFYELGLYDMNTILSDPNILAHSSLFTALQETGFLGGLLWIYFLILLFRGVSSIKYTSQMNQIIMLPIMLYAIWHILFSPLVSYNRIIIAAAIALSINLSIFISKNDAG
jgi:O-antigen ligase